MFTSLLRRPRSRENYIKTLSRLFEFSTVAFRKLPMSKYVDGSQAYTYGTFRHEVMNLSRLMSRFGVSAGDRVAILSQNMPNWTVAMFSAVSFGRIAVPILPDSSAAEVENIIKHSGAKVLFISKRLMFKVSKELLEQLTLVIETDTLHLIRHDDDSFTCEGWVKEPQPDELAAIIYTSGTSGNAKGVMLSHRNFCQNIKAAYHAQKTRKRHVWLSILPMAHTYEMAFSVLYPIYVGGCVNYLQKAPTPSILLQAMKSVRPHIMLSVPLIIEKVYRSSVVPTIEKSRVLTWMRKRFPRLLYYLVGRKLYASFGGRLIFFGIGGSKL
ncbi:MAG: AMP-binding protein, partial [Bacteroidales bacterium]|nr:AMP-binding protein [Bacteroidales bacterium]